MFRFIAKTVAVSLLLACAVALAEERGTIVEKGKDRFETEFAPGGRLELEVRSGDVRISGSDSNRISIHYEGRHGDDVANVVVHCKKMGSTTALEISGGPRNEFQIRIEIPRETDLQVRMPLENSTSPRCTGPRMWSCMPGSSPWRLAIPKITRGLKPRC
jgi:hypothetical protein